MPEYFVSGQQASVQWSALGYHQDYDQVVVLSVCDPECTKVLQSAPITKARVDDGSWTYGNAQSQRFRYQYTFTAPPVPSSAYLQIRFYRRSKLDQGGSFASLLVPSKVASISPDTSGRKIYKPLYPALTPNLQGPDLNLASYASNTNPYFAAGYSGQCTWYAWGRVHDELGVTLSWPGFGPGDGKTWWLVPATGTRASSAAFVPRGPVPLSDSVAVWNDDRPQNTHNFGHVAYVEHVDADHIWFSEANYPLKAPGGEIKKATLEEFKLRNNTLRLSGFLYPAIGATDLVKIPATNLDGTTGLTLSFTLTNLSRQPLLIEDYRVLAYTPSGRIAQTMRALSGHAGVLGSGETQGFEQIKGSLAQGNYHLVPEIKVSGHWIEVLERTAFTAQ